MKNNFLKIITLQYWGPGFAKSGQTRPGPDHGQSIFNCLLLFPTIFTYFPLILLIFDCLYLFIDCF